MWSNWGFNQRKNFPWRAWLGLPSPGIQKLKGMLNIHAAFMLQMSHSVRLPPTSTCVLCHCRRCWCSKQFLSTWQARYGNTENANKELHRFTVYLLRDENQNMEARDLNGFNQAFKTQLLRKARKFFKMNGTDSCWKWGNLGNPCLINSILFSPNEKIKTSVLFWKGRFLKSLRVCMWERERTHLIMQETYLKAFLNSTSKMHMCILTLAHFSSL